MKINRNTNNPSLTKPYLPISIVCFYCSLLYTNFLLISSPHESKIAFLGALTFVGLAGVGLSICRGNEKESLWALNLLIVGCCILLIKYWLFDGVFPPRKYYLYLLFFTVIYTFKQSSKNTKIWLQSGNQLSALILSVWLSFSVITYGYHNVQSGSHSLTDWLPISLTDTCVLISCLLIPHSRIGNKVLAITSAVSGLVAAYLTASLLLALVASLAFFALTVWPGLSKKQLLMLGLTTTVVVLMMALTDGLNVLRARWTDIINSAGYLSGVNVLWGGGHSNFSFYYSNAIFNGIHEARSGLINGIAHNDFINLYLSGGAVSVFLFVVLLYHVARNFIPAAVMVVLILAASYPVEQLLTSSVLAATIGHWLEGSIVSDYDDRSSKYRAGPMLFVMVVLLLTMILDYSKKVSVFNGTKPNQVDLHRFDEQALVFLYTEAVKNKDVSESYLAACELNSLSNSYESFVFLGDALDKMGQYENAISAYKKAKIINPGMSYPQYKIFYCELYQGDFNGAVKACEELASSHKNYRGMYYLAFQEEVNEAVKKNELYKSNVVERVRSFGLK